ncbi:MAG TPA: CHRD domain-containing protein [Acidimicrobiales bacterium]|nr:CHRD domain-containing protein [Acidimicrobiales bacterium]
MRKHIWSAVAIAAAVLFTGACGDDDDETVERAEREARETATSVERRVEEGTRLRATLTGSAEAPTPGDPDGTGTASINLDATEGRVCFEVSVQNIDPPVGMHIHEAEAGKSGPIVVPLPTPTTATTPATGCVDADRTLIGRIAANPDDFYLNVHTQPFPQGAVRGQLSQ